MILVRDVISWHWIATIIWVLLLAYFCIRLLQKILPGASLYPQPTIKELKKKYLQDGRPAQFYVSDDWFNYVFTDALWHDPNIKLFRDRQGLWIPFGESKLRPESSRQWAKAGGSGLTSMRP